MKIRILIRLFALQISIIIFQGCSSYMYDTVYPTLGDGKYDSEFPYKSSSNELTKLSETIQRLSATAFYKIYIFDEKSKLELSDLSGKNLQKIAVTEAYANNSSAGSAVTVFSENGNIALLTCAHTITFPDTIIAYQIDKEGKTTNFVESISIIEKEVIYIAGFPEGSRVDILAKDDQKDIALVGKKYSSLSNINLPAFKYPIGKAKELEWGSFVYLFGYPLNYKIITKAIVSSPRKDENGSFVVDAVVNPGFSGGVVLAIRDGVPNFELVGIVQWVPEEDENLLYPEELKGHLNYNPVVPYKGNIFVRKHKSIKYGIAKVIPVESIMAFLLENKSYLNSKGFYIFP